MIPLGKNMRQELPGKNMSAKLIKIQTGFAQNQFFRFLLSGGLAALANFGSRFLFSDFFPYVTSITLAFLVGLVTAFLLMRAFVFAKAKKSTARQVAYFITVNLVGLAVTIAVSVEMSRFLGLMFHDVRIDETLGHLSGICAPVLLSFYAHKYITFK